jgi:hypothetical protein
MMVKTVLLILAALAALILGCGTEGGESTSADERFVRGRLTDVQAASLLEIESITVETESGETYVLEAGNRIFSGFTPSHLREHMLQGNLVTALFEDEGDKLILKDVLD